MPASRSLLTRAQAAWRAFRRNDRDFRPRMAAGSFAGATQSQLYADFMATILSPDSELRGDIAVMRGRARTLVRDNAHAAGYVRELANQVIGPNGIMLQAKIANASGQPSKKTNAEIERGWTEWGMPEHCTADGHDSWLDVQQTIMKTLPVDGEIILQKLPYFDNPFGFSVRFIDPDLLDESFNRPAAPGTNEIRMGVELNAWGRPVAYHFWTRHPSDISAGRLERKRVDASEIIHRFVRYRPNQTRGVTWFAPVLLAFRMIDGYQEAELVASRSAAVKWAAWVNTNAEQGGVDLSSPDGAPREWEMRTGVIDQGPPGYDLRTFDPTHPNSAFDGFTKAIYRAIACGLGMAYTTFTGDLTAVNYSSIRAGLLSERDAYRTMQNWLAIQVCRPVYRSWLEMALLYSAIAVDSRLASKYYEVAWRGRGWKWVDPTNDMQAASQGIALGIVSRQRLAAETGDDFEAIIDEIAYETEYARQAGVVLGANAAVEQTKVTVDNPNMPGAGNGEHPDDRDQKQTDETSGKPTARRVLHLPHPRERIAR